MGFYKQETPTELKQASAPWEPPVYRTSHKCRKGLHESLLFIDTCFRLHRSLLYDTSNFLHT
jgi:hypothetical protein